MNLSNILEALQSSPQLRTLAGTTLVFVCLATHGCWRFQSNTTSAREAEQSYSESRKLASQILELQSQPAFAGQAGQGNADVSKQLSSAIKTAGIRSDVVQGVDPGRPERIQGTDLQKQSTLVSLAAISMESAVKIMHHMSASELGLTVTMIEFTPLSEVESQLLETWNVRFEVTQILLDG